MRSCLVTDAASVRGDRIGRIMTPGAVFLEPVPAVCPRRGLIVAPHAIVLLMADGAPLAIPFGHEAVGQVPPGVRMVARRAGIVTGDAVALFVAGKTGDSVLCGLAAVHARRCPMELDPAAPVGIRPRKRDFVRPCPGLSGADHGYGTEDDGGCCPLRYGSNLKSHSEAPLCPFDTVRCRIHIHTPRSPICSSRADTVRSGNRCALSLSPPFRRNNHTYTGCSSSRC